MTLLTNKQLLLFTLIHLSHWFLKENVKSNLKMSKCVEVQACLMPIFTEMTRGWVNMSIWNEVLQNYLLKKKTTHFSTCGMVPVLWCIKTHLSLRVSSPHRDFIMPPAVQPLETLVCSDWSDWSDGSVTASLHKHTPGLTDLIRL